MTDFFDNLTNLIEKASHQNDDRPVIFITHSMGGPVLQAFLNTVSNAWKKQFVRAFFPVQAPWLGSVKVLLAILAGDSLGTPAQSSELVAMERTLESVLYLHPDPKHWPEKDVDLLTINSTQTTYTVHTVDALLKDLKIQHGSQRLAFVDKQLSQLTPPGVETYCIHGADILTPFHYHFETLGSNKPSKVEFGNGDGTVPIHSLAHCETWREKQEQAVHVETFAKTEHVAAIQSSEAVYAYIASKIETL